MNFINFIGEFKLQTESFFSLSLIDTSALELISNEIALDDGVTVKAQAHCPSGAHVAPEGLLSPSQA